MTDSIDMMGMARSLMRHAGQRQGLLARNVANADTPGYRAVDTAAFDPGAAAPLGLRATRPQHVPAISGGGAARIVAVRGEAAPNGNTVSLEDELARGADIRRQGDLALTVYQSGLRLMRSAIGRGR